MTETTQTAQPLAGPMDLPVRPVAWIDSSGHPKHLSHMQGAAERRLYGPLKPLYDRAALSAAVAAERERCAALCEVWNTTPGRRLATLVREA